MIENEREIKCASYGKRFLLRKEEYERLTQQKKRPSSYCKFCRKEYYEKMHTKREQEENVAYRMQRREEHEKIESCANRGEPKIEKER